VTAPLPRRLVALLVLAVVGVSGCASLTDGSPQSRPSATGSSDEPSPSVADPSDSAGPPEEGAGGPANAEKINPCSLVTKAEADQLSGVTLQPAIRTLQLCTFPTPTSGTVAQLEIFVGDGAKKYFDIDKIDLAHPFHRVPGVGDQAWAEEGAIFVEAKGIWFGLRLTRLDEVDTGPALARLAAAVAGRL
jgi:hypothetical protein